MTGKLVIIIFIVSLQFSISDSVYEVQVSPATHVSVDTKCKERLRPSVKIATRYAVSTKEQFGGWNLVLFTAGGR